MTRMPTTFKQADVCRAIRAATASGLSIERTEIHRDGRIVLVHAPETSATPADEFDTWQRTNGSN